MGGAGLMMDVGGPPPLLGVLPLGQAALSCSRKHAEQGGRQLAAFFPLCHRVYGLCCSSCPVVLRDGAFPPQVPFVHGVLSQQ